MNKWFKKVFCTSIFDRMDYHEKEVKSEIEENKKIFCTNESNNNENINEEIDVEIKFFDDTKVKKSVVLSKDVLFQILDDPFSTKDQRMKANSLLKDLNNY